MRFLRAHHITNLVAVVDSFLPRAAANPKGGRPLVLHPNEVIALLLFSSFVAPQRTMKDAQLRFMDSTMLHVCKLVRADRHRVARGAAAFGKNWRGWHYGFKLHAAVDPEGKLAAVYFTPANEHDGQQIPHLVNDATAIAVGDGTYDASVMRRKMWHEHQAYILAPPHPKQNKKLIQQWQLLLLHTRAKVECTFDYLKEHLLLETSFPRSVNGYAIHYIRTLLAYQLMWGF